MISSIIEEREREREGRRALLAATLRPYEIIPGVKGAGDIVAAPRRRDKRTLRRRLRPPSLPRDDDEGAHGKGRRRAARACAPRPVMEFPNIREEPSLNFEQFAFRVKCN